MKKIRAGAKKIVTVRYVPTLNGKQHDSVYYGSAGEARRVADSEAQRRSGMVVCDCGRVVSKKPGSREQHMAVMIQALLYALPKHWDERISEQTRAKIEEAAEWVRQIESNKRGVIS